MDQSMIKGVVIGGVAMVVLAAGAVPTYKALTKPKFAEVTSVNEVTETVVTPREECNDVQVQKQAPAQDSDRVAGTVIGGIAGGLLCRRTVSSRSTGTDHGSMLDECLGNTSASRGSAVRKSWR